MRDPQKAFETQALLCTDLDADPERLFSIVALFAHQRMTQSTQAVRQAAWYRKFRSTFADTLALVRKELWAQERTFYGSPSATETLKVSRAFVERLTDALCYAA